MVAWIVAFVLMGIAFHLLQEDRHFTMFSSVLHKLQRLNLWVVGWSGISSGWLIGIEVGVLVSVGALMLDLEQYALAVGVWVIMAFLVVAKAFAWKGLPNRPLSAFLQTAWVLAALSGCVLLITSTNLKRDGKDWVQKLWGRQPPFSMRITAVYTNSAIHIWELQETTAHPNVPFCEVPIGAEVYLTNEISKWTMISDFRAEGMNSRGEWETLSVVNSSAPIYTGPNMRQAIGIQAKYFDQQIWDKNLGPNETVSGLLLLYSKPGVDIRGPFRFTLSDMKEKSYVIGPVGYKADKLPPINFTLAGPFVDISGMVPRECASRW